MRKDILSYSAPEVEIFEVAAERGYGDSVLLPGFGTEDDEFVYQNYYEVNGCGASSERPTIFFAQPEVEATDGIRRLREP